MRVLLSPKSRAELFEHLKNKYSVSYLDDLAKKMKISPKTVNNWRYDYKKYLPSYLLDLCPLTLEILDKQPDNWGMIKGGKKDLPKKIENLKKRWEDEKYKNIMKKTGQKSIKILQKKYGPHLKIMALEGRLKNRVLFQSQLEKEYEYFFTQEDIILSLSEVVFSPNDSVRGVLLPTKMTPRLAEEIGIHLGDGCLSRKKYYYSVKTNKKEEDYMVHFIFPLFKELYNIDLKLMRLESVSGFEIYSRAIYEFKNKVLGIPIGNKVERIEVPEVILNTKNAEVYKAFIRGLFDTDGCVSIQRTKNNYPVITFTIKSQKLILQVKDMLHKLGFIPAASKYKIDLNGCEMLYKWVKEIHSNNPKNMLQLTRASSLVDRIRPCGQ